MTQERPFPRIPIPRAAVVVVVFAAFAAAMVWRFAGYDFLLPVTLFVAVALACFFYYRRRCQSAEGVWFSDGTISRARADFAACMIAIIARLHGTGERLETMTSHDRAA